MTQASFGLTLERGGSLIKARMQLEKQVMMVGGVIHLQIIADRKKILSQIGAYNLGIYIKLVLAAAQARIDNINHKQRGERDG